MIGWLGCGDAADPATGQLPMQPASRETPDPPSDCVVARGTGFEIVLADIEPARLGSTPPMTTDRAIRLTIDAWLAEWDTTGAVGRLAPGDRLALHRSLVSKDRADWPTRRHAAATALELRYGPCYPGAL